MTQVAKTKNKKKLLSICLLIASLFVLTTGCGADQKAEKPDSTEKNAIGIIGAMDVEIDTLKSAANIESSTEVAGMEFMKGTLGDKPVVIVKCGMGKVNAGICANTLIHEFGCKEIINTGVAGSLDNRIDIGDIVVSTDAVQHDFDVEPIGFKRGEIPYTGKIAFEADEEMRRSAVEAIKETVSDVNYFEGRVCSGDQFIDKNKKKKAITSRFGGLCCEMEGGAIAHTCYLNSTPFVIIRAISDKEDGSASMEYEIFQEAAANHCAKIVEYMVEKKL